MKRWIGITVCLSIAVVTFGLYQLIDAARELTISQKGAATAAIHEEALNARAWIAYEVLPIFREAVNKLDARAANLERDADSQLTATRADAVAEIDGIRSDLAETRSQLLQRVDGLRSDVQPALKALGAAAEKTDGTAGQLEKTVADLHPQLLGLVAAGKVTAGETAQTMRDFRDAVPQLLKTAQETATHIDEAAAKSAEASENTAKVTANLAAATKPLPRAVRLGLQIAGPLAQAANYIVLILFQLGIL